MQDYEKLGLFYLGKSEAQTAEQSDELLLYDSRELTTHAVILGMTGSGKTGLAAALIEEAAIDGIPAILIDPKGDLGNLMLQFPNLAGADFLPWVDHGEAQRRAQTPEQFADATANKWREGLAAWGQDGARIKRLQNSAEFAIYTPGNTSGRPLQVLRSFNAPNAAVVQDSSALRERVLAVVSGLLSLLGRNADPVQSRDHILLSTILETAWLAGRSLDLAAIIMEIQKPPFATVGVFDLETFYPARERMGLAMSLNNILASPGFSAWTQGETLDIQRLLYTPEGKPRVTTLYLAHLSDAERMFFVTVLLNEILAWMRQQSGTNSLRAMLYMDEIFGYFPPGANPPSKLPMLTLLKQARAFGLGVVLSTQNPVDLDYKGLANCGTWFIGRMQTSRDVARVVAGLESAASGSGTTLNRAELERLLAGLGNRRFLLRNVNDDQPTLFETRWVMSYLRGPMTLPQVASFAAPAVDTPPTAATPTAPITASGAPAASSGAPTIPADITQCFLRSSQTPRSVIYEPRILGNVQLHFVDARSNLDTWHSYAFVAPFGADGSAPEWSAATHYADGQLEFDPHALEAATYTELPLAATIARNYTLWVNTLKNMINQEVVLEQWLHANTKLVSNYGESEGDFKVRVGNKIRELRDAEVDKLRTRYAAKFQTLSDQIRRANERVERQKSQAGQQKLSAMLSIGAALAGAFMGRSVKSIGNVGRASTAARSAGRIGQKQGDIERAQENLDVLQARQDEMQQQLDQEIDALQAKFDPSQVDVERRIVRPRKTEITLTSDLSLCWTPLT